MTSPRTCSLFLALLLPLAFSAPGCRRGSDATKVVPLSAPPPTSPPPISPEAEMAPVPATVAPIVKAPSEPVAAPPEVSTGDPEVAPVYAKNIDAPHPLAVQACAALYDLPTRRRAECCGGKPGIGFSSECLRNVTGALNAGAITIDAAAIERCAEAMTRDLAGCDWVAPFPIFPAPPPECAGLAMGTLPLGESCRSSLECASDANCAGAGPTAQGKCALRREEGSCGGRVDVLATYLRDASLDGRHPECTGFCDGRRCAPVVPVGAPCKHPRECGAEGACVDGACQKGPPGAVGQPCFGGRCASGLRCAKDQKCVALLEEGATCSDESQCRAACVRSPTTSPTGTCRAHCLTRPTEALRLPAGVKYPPRRQPK